MGIEILRKGKLSKKDKTEVHILLELSKEDLLSIWRMDDFSDIAKLRRMNDLLYSRCSIYLRNKKNLNQDELRTYCTYEISSFLKNPYPQENYTPNYFN